MVQHVSWRLTFSWLLIASLTLVIASALFAQSNLRLLVERTRSMAPQLIPGDLVLAQPVSKSTRFIPGQIASYRFNTMLITHRIIAVEPNGTYIFKGDNNVDADPLPVSRDQIEATYIVHVPQAGEVLETATRPGGRLAIAALLAILTGICLRIRQLRRRSRKQSLLQFPSHDRLTRAA
jgi:signal peptidase I